MTEAGAVTIADGYLLPGEDVPMMFSRLSSAAAKRLEMPELEAQFLDALEKGYFCLASPILSNFGTDRGLPISCYGQTIPDSIDGIYKSLHEFSMVTKGGGGCSQYWGEVRPQGAYISGGKNGKSNGSVPFAKCFDTAVTAVSQGNVRRGANAFYWPADHLDRDAALKIRDSLGTDSLRCRDSHHAFIFGDEMMKSIISNASPVDRKFWFEVIKTRLQDGEPFMMFSDNANKHNSVRLRRIYEKFGLRNRFSNICTEIILPTDERHTFVCCISSLPLHRFLEWKDKGIVRLMTFFLDAVLDEFIEKASAMPGMEKAVRFATKSRAIGIGVLGFHSFLQDQRLEFGSFQARSWNRLIFKTIRDEAEEASRELALLRGEPEWCVGEGYRHTHLMAVAPTATNSIISGQVSPGAEVWSSNIFSAKTAKASFICYNPALKKELALIGRDNEESWQEINEAQGSVQNLDWFPNELKPVFKTAYEIDMRDVVAQAAARSEFVDQGQSINFFFQPPELTGMSDVQQRETMTKYVKYVNKCHIDAWKSGIKTLYYCRSKQVVTPDSASRKDAVTASVIDAPKEPLVGKKYFYLEQEDGACKSCEG